MSSTIKIFRYCYLAFALILCSYLHAQDSLQFNGKTYHHIVYYEDTAAVKIAGNYLPNSKIKEGEWLCFYKNGQVCLRMNFEKDLKKGKWYWYNEEGGLVKTAVMKEKNKDGITLDDGVDVFMGIIRILLCLGSGKC